MADFDKICKLMDDKFSYNRGFMLGFQPNHHCRLIGCSFEITSAQVFITLSFEQIRLGLQVITLESLDQFRMKVSETTLPQLGFSFLNESLLNAGPAQESLLFNFYMTEGTECGYQYESPGVRVVDMGMGQSST